MLQNRATDRSDDGLSAKDRNLVKALPWIILFALLSGCDNEENSIRPSQEDTGQIHELPAEKEFFADWFRSHGHPEIVMDARGVGVPENATRLHASTYQTKEHQDGGHLAELEFRARLESGREIIEFVAGLGETEEVAVVDSMANFVLTTFHPVHKVFINTDDPHITAQQIRINGQDRQLIAGDIYLRGGPQSGSLELGDILPKVEAALRKLKISSDPHWIKLVYGQFDGQPSVVSATIDNEADSKLTSLLAQLGWPPHESSYMAKQFIVIK